MGNSPQNGVASTKKDQYLPLRYGAQNVNLRQLTAFPENRKLPSPTRATFFVTVEFFVSNNRKKAQRRAGEEEEEEV